MQLHSLPKYPTLPVSSESLFLSGASWSGPPLCSFQSSSLVSLLQNAHLVLVTVFVSFPGRSSKLFAFLHQNSLKVLKTTESDLSEHQTCFGAVFYLSFISCCLIKYLYKSHFKRNGLFGSQLQITVCHRGEIQAVETWSSQSRQIPSQEQRALNSLPCSAQLSSLSPFLHSPGLSAPGAFSGLTSQGPALLMVPSQVLSETLGSWGFPCD